jgi:D-xylose transport system substrate-binding protein
MGRGLVSCAAAWHVAKPHVVVLGGDGSDNTAALLAGGFDDVLRPLVKKGRWTTVSLPPGTGYGPMEIGSILSAHREVNAALFADAGTGSGIVTALKSRHTRPKSFPAAGFGATVPALDDILTGYLCGTVVEPVVAEAQAAVALALYIRAGATPPRSLVNGTVEDTVAQVRVPSVVLAPVWVTASNMRSTVVHDGTVRIGRLCTRKYATACRAAGLSGEQRH